MKRFRLFTLLFLLISVCSSAPVLADTGVSPWWRSAVVYEIFVRSFQDTDGDGIGDLAGVASRLDYLQSLGVTAIWLTPIYPANTYHGYDTIDFENVNPTYGDLSGMASLIAQAHQHGIRIILDMAVNETSVDHAWFQSAAQGEFSLFRDYYLWSPTPVNWTTVTNAATHWHLLGDQYYYSTFGAAHDRADLNWNNPAVLTAVQSAFDFWTALGVDGFRLDAAMYLIKGSNGETNQPGTHAIWKSIVQNTREKAPQTMFVGEVWSDQPTISTYYGAGDELDQCFDFPVAGALVQSLQQENAGFFRSSLAQMLQSEQSIYFASPFVTNHDQVRVATRVAQDLQKLKLAAVSLMTLPGTPYVYYGEEIGLPNGVAAGFTGDLGKRTPMQWLGNAPEKGFSTAQNIWNPIATQDPVIAVDTQLGDPASLLNTYKALIQIHKTQSAILTGSFQLNTVSDPEVLSYSRTDSSGTMVVVINFSRNAKSSVNVQLASTLPASVGNPTNLYWVTAPSGFQISTPQSLTITNMAALSASVTQISF